MNTGVAGQGGRPSSEATILINLGPHRTKPSRFRLARFLPEIIRVRHTARPEAKRLGLPVADGQKTTLSFGKPKLLSFRRLVGLGGHAVPTMTTRRWMVLVAAMALLLGWVSKTHRLR